MTLTDIQTPTGKLWGHVSYPVISKRTFSSRNPLGKGDVICRQSSCWPRVAQTNESHALQLWRALLWNADNAECPQSRWLSVCSTRRFWSERWPYQQGKNPTQLIIIHHREPAKHPSRINELQILACIWFKSARYIFRLDFICAKRDLDQWFSTGFSSGSRIHNT